MTLLTTKVPTRTTASSARGTRPRPRRQRGSSEVVSLLVQGEPFLWLTGGALALCVVMILALLILVAALGLSTFHPAALLQLQLRDGRTLLGEVAKTEHYDLTAERLLSESDQVQAVVLQELVDELGGHLAALPDQVQRSRGRLATRIADVQQRIAWASDRVTRLSQQATDNTKSPFERSRDIAARRNDMSLIETRAEWVALESRLAALQQEQQAIDAAATYFAVPDRCSLPALQAAELPLKQVGVSAVLDLIAAQRNDDVVRVRRRLLRTGNFELTNEHFQWVSDYEVADQGSSYPDRAATVERISWGRFYGMPQRFTLRQPAKCPAQSVNCRRSLACCRPIARVLTWPMRLCWINNCRHCTRNTPRRTAVGFRNSSLARRQQTPCHGRRSRRARPAEAADRADGPG